MQGGHISRALHNLTGYLPSLNDIKVARKDLENPKFRPLFPLIMKVSTAPGAQLAACSS